MYAWRKMTVDQRTEAMKLREIRRMPFHSPPHSREPGWHRYHLSAANFDHAPILGQTTERMTSFAAALCEVLGANDVELFAWCVLPNHWHGLVGTDDLKELLKAIAQLHGQSSFRWNGEETRRGRQCWHCCSDRRIRTDNHFHATRNYIHHNPVKHRYVKRWDEWPFSSAVDFLEEVGREKVAELWTTYPVLNMGESWDVD